MFWFFRKGLFFKGARHMGTGFQRHGLETSSEFVILLIYDMAGVQNAECGSHGMGAECFTT